MSSPNCMLPIEPSLLASNQYNDTKQSEYSYEDAASLETPTKRRKRGRPKKRSPGLPGLGEPWQVAANNSSPSRISAVPSSDVGNVPPSLGMYTSSPTAESPQTVKKPRSLKPLRHRLSMSNDIHKNMHITENHQTLSSPCKHSSPSNVPDNTTLRGLSINDIPSSPIQGYHVSFSKDDDNDGSHCSRLSSRSASPTARKSLKRTFSEQSVSETTITSVNAFFTAPGDRRVNFVIENGRASVTHTDDNEGDSADDESISASSVSTHSIAPSQLKAPINNQMHNQMIGSIFRQYSYESAFSTINKLPSWDMSDSDSDSDGSMPKYSAYSVYEKDSAPVTADAMAAFAQTVARSRAKEKVKATTPPLQLSRGTARHSGGRTASSRNSNVMNVLQTPVTRTAGYPYRYSPFLKEDSTMPKVLASPYAAASAGSAFALAVTATSVSSQDHSASTPPGSMLLVDDVFTAFGSTGMTPYLPSRSS